MANFFTSGVFAPDDFEFLGVKSLNVHEFIDVSEKLFIEIVEDFGVCVGTVGS